MTITNQVDSTPSPETESDYDFSLRLLRSGDLRTGDIERFERVLQANNRRGDSCGLLLQAAVNRREQLLKQVPVDLLKEQIERVCQEPNCFGGIAVARTAILIGEQTSEYDQCFSKQFLQDVALYFLKTNRLGNYDRNSSSFLEPIIDISNRRGFLKDLIANYDAANELLFPDSKVNLRERSGQKERGTYLKLIHCVRTDSFTQMHVDIHCIPGILKYLELNNSLKHLDVLIGEAGVNKNPNRLTAILAAAVYDIDALPDLLSLMKPMILGRDKPIELVHDVIETVRLSTGHHFYNRSASNTASQQSAIYGVQGLVKQCLTHDTLGELFSSEAMRYTEEHNLRPNDFTALKLTSNALEYIGKCFDSSTWRQLGDIASLGKALNAYDFYLNSNNQRPPEDIVLGLEDFLNTKCNKPRQLDRSEIYEDTQNGTATSIIVDGLTPSEAESAHKTLMNQILA